jgi:hypothetical protein
LLLDVARAGCRGGTGEVCGGLALAAALDEPMRRQSGEEDDGEDDGEVLEGGEVVFARGGAREVAWEV